jgi:ribosome-associated translation inhibitor RaiA
MQIDVLGEHSISPQARSYAEYRLFAALSQVVDTGRVRRARLALRRSKHEADSESVSCTVTVELDTDEVLRIRTTGEHPYAAINRAVARLSEGAGSIRHLASSSRSPATADSKGRRRPVIGSSKR